MRNYEIMYILRADLDEAARAAQIEKMNKILTDNGAKVNAVDEKMGMRDLAYPINKQVKGYYVVEKVSADEKALNEFNRLNSIDSAVIRLLVVVDHE